MERGSTSFFGQEGLSQDQDQSQFVNGSWSGYNNGLGGKQRQIDPSLVANLKSYSTQPSDDSERGQSSNSQHGFTQQLPIRSEYSRSLLQDNQQLANGYMHGQAMPNGSSFLGMDVTSSRDNLSAQGFSPNLHKSPMRFEMGESPVNYDFFGGQQQSNSQLPAMLQPFPRQQMTFNDMQLLKQQAMVKQMHQYQTQQQLQKQQLEGTKLNSLNPNGVSGNRYQSHPLINGVPIQDASSNNWQPGLMRMHRGISPALSSGDMITPEHRQANLLPQQFEPSLYGMPLGGINVSQNSFSSVQMNRLPAQHGSSLINQPTSFVNQGDVQDGHMVQEKFGQMESSGPSEKPYMKEPENVNVLQKSTSLDPAEEKILFGSDDNLWDAFGNNTDMNLTGNLISSSSDLLDASPSMKLGSWSALMQSAVAETSSNDAGFGTSIAQNLGGKASNVPSERLHSDSTRTSAQHVHENGVSEKPMAQRSQLAGNFFSSSSSGIDRQNNSCSVQKNEGDEDSFGIWKAASNPSLAAPVEQKNHFTQNLQMQRATYGFDIANAGNNSSGSRDVQGNIQQPLNNNSAEKAFPQVNSRDGSHTLESYASNTAAETDEVRNSGKNSNDSSRFKFSQESLTHGFKKDTQVHAPDLSMFPGGKETQAGHVGSRPSISRMFQYHPMVNIGVSDEPNPNREEVSHLPPALEQVSVGNQGYFGQSKPLGQPPMNMLIDRGHVSQNDLNCRNEAFKGLLRSQNSTNASASADRSVDNQMKSASRQPMLELLDKVDQSQEHSFETDVSKISEATPSAENDGQFRHSQSSGSQGFSLQLAPPSQPASSPDDVQFPMNSLQPLNSLHSAREKGTSQSRFALWASNQSFPQQSTYQGTISGIPGERNITSGFPYPRGYNQSQLMPVATRQSVSNHPSSELSAPQVKEREECSDFDQHRHSAQTSSRLNPTEGLTMLSTPQPPVVSSSPKQSSSTGMMSDSRAGISTPQHRFWNQPSKSQQDILRPHPFSNSHIEGSFSSQEKKHRLSSQNGGDMSLSGRDTVNMLGLQSKDMGAKQTSIAASMFPKMVQSNQQTFDSSLPSNNLPKENLRDEHMVGSGEGGTPQMSVKRMENSSVHLQKVASKGEQQSPSRSDGLVRDGLNHKESPNQMLHFGKTVSQSFSNKNHSASAGADHQQISPQMAPSWYSQYGTFKNGLVQPVNDSGRFTPLKIGEQSSNGGSSADGLHSVPSSKQFNMPGSTPGAETPSSESLAHGATDKLLNVVKPKKRKTATSDLLSWNKEVTEGPLRLKTLSDAEVDWVRATNRFADKVGFETLLEDGPPIRSKKRLIYTRQLTQQLFPPSAARVISLPASSHYESVAYTAARAALGDACSSTSTDMSVLSPRNKSSPLSERTKAETISDQYVSKAAEDFISRSRKLETDFAGLQNGTTIADLCVEVQDLEKFAVINRFAKFHPTSSSMDRTVSSLKLNPQRYVTIAPMPQNIPDRVQCLSL